MNFLDAIFSTDDFNEAERSLILPKFKRVSFAKDEYLLLEGKTEQHYWYLETGFVRSYVNDVEGNDITTHFYSTGDVVIDWSSFFLQLPSKENIQALTDCVAWQLDIENFQILFNTVEQFRNQGRTKLVSAYFELKNKSVAMIAEQAKDRYIQLLEEKPHIVQNVSLQHIATYLGITKYSLSRIRKEISK